MWIESVRPSYETASRWFLWGALAVLSAGCGGLNPPENLRLDVLGQLPDESQCGENRELREERGVEVTLEPGGGFALVLAYAVVCSRERGETFIRDGLAVGWGEQGELVARGEFRKGEPAGQWEIYHPNGQLRARVNSQGAGQSVGEYFTEDGSPDLALTFIDVARVGTSKAYDDFMASFPEAEQVAEARQLAKAARFRESGALVSGPHFNGNARGLSAAFYHLAQEPRKDPFETKCETYRDSRGPTTHCWVPEESLKEVRGVALRPSVCEDKETYGGSERECEVAASESPFVEGTKHGLWIDFPDGYAQGPCEWGRYELGNRVGLWVRWDKCFRRHHSNNLFHVRFGLEKGKDFDDWWDEEKMNEKIAETAMPGMASGRQIRLMIVNCDAPSSRAASSRS